MIKRRSYLLLTGYLTRELLQNFLVAFIFFFCIFFVNSILLLVQRILLKNIDFLTMLEMVSLSMPQFLVYTFPFATLASSSMVLGDLSSTNELLAIRSCGISKLHIYFPLVLFSILMSVVTFIFADIVHPWSSAVYKEKLGVLMADMPTFELEPNSVNSVGNVILYNGNVDGRDVYDLVLMNKEDDELFQTIISEKGTLDLLDNKNYVYSLDLISPNIFLNEKDSVDSFVLSSGEKATLFLDFSNQIPSLTSNSPVNLTSRELIESIKVRGEAQKEDRKEYYRSLSEEYLGISSLLKEIEDENNVSSYESRALRYNINIQNKGNPPTSFTAQYHKAELTKKFALSFACFVFALVTLPLSNIRVKHGKLTGFAISLLLAVAYWYMLFGAQLMIFNITSSPYLLILSPDLAILAIAIAALVYFRRAR